VQVIGKIVCFCDEILELAPIDQVKVVHTTTDAVEILKRRTKIPADDHQWDEAVSALVGLGCMKREAQKIVEDAVNDGVYDGDMDDFIRYLVSRRI
jgi:Holliday junction resolvasome RuvABC DNA-binding subunit